MDFEKFLRDILKKFQEGDSSKHYISGGFYGFFPYLLDKDEFEEGQRAMFYTFLHFKCRFIIKLKLIYKKDNNNIKY